MQPTFAGVLGRLALLAILGLPASVATAQQATGGDNPAAAPPTASAHAHHRGPKMLEMGIPEDAVVTLWQPDLVTRSITAEHGHVAIPKTGMDNYHAVVAVSDSDGIRDAVIRYEYRFGKPSGRSPRELAAAQKTDFEIVPDPIPREHRHYQSGETWPFLLRYRGAPVAGAKVVLTTQFGNVVEGVSNAAGEVRLAIPDDFPGIVPGERDERQAAFDVVAEHHADGRLYRTRLNAEYRVNPSHWQSLTLGLLVTGFGMLAGGFLGRIGLKRGKGRVRA